MTEPKRAKTSDEPCWRDEKVTAQDLPAWFIVQYGKGTRDFGVKWQQSRQKTVRFSHTSNGFLGQEDAVLHYEKDPEVDGDYTWEKRGVYKVHLRPKYTLMRARVALHPDSDELEAKHQARLQKIKQKEEQDAQKIKDLTEEIKTKLVELRDLCRETEQWGRQEWAKRLLKEF